jgi:cytochrome P450
MIEPERDFEYHEIDFVTGQPYEQWARARERCPVFETDGTLTGDAARPLFHVTRWDDVERVLRDPAGFSSSINLEHMRPYMGELILGLDGAEHRAYRNLVAHAFRASQLERWDAASIRPSIGMLVDEIAPRGKADLVQDITRRYPVRVICAIVGVPVEDSEQFHAWAEQINGGPLHPAEGLAASRAMREYLEPLVEARRVEPTGDLLSDLVHAEIDGVRLSDERLYGFLRLLLPAGAETTYRALGNALTALLTQPELMSRVRDDPSVRPAFIEETLRWETSVTQVSRVATSATEISGCPVPAGAAVAVLVGSADRDESRFSHPEQFDLDRPSQNHLAFGTGPHQCLGMHLARLELRAGLDTILDGLPNLRLDPDADIPRIEGLAFRGPVELPVVFDARPTSPTVG